MILGLGTDVLDIRRIDRTIRRFGARFTHRVFTARERARAESRPNAAASLAMRFAAKEACAKALGTGIDRAVFWRDIEICSPASGRPAVRLARGARARLDALVPDGMVSRIDLSMSDEPPVAMATVIISAVPGPPGR